MISLMGDGVAHKFGVGAALAHQVDAALLVGGIFRMLQRQIEEHPVLLVRQRQIEAAPDRRLGHGPRLRIGGKGLRRIAIHVARQLIEQDDQRQRAFRRFLPAIQFAGQSLLVGGLEILPDFVIEFRILVEPALPGRRRKPEIEDILRFGHRRLPSGRAAVCQHLSRGRDMDTRSIAMV